MHGEAAILEVADLVRAFALRSQVADVAFDPWRAACRNTLAVMPSRSSSAETLTPRSRIDKPNGRVHIDGIIALCMACDRHGNQAPPAQLVGWI